MKLSVVVAAYNERGTVETILDRVRRAELPAGLTLEIVVVDDGSSDGTTEILRSLAERWEFRLFVHPENRGKGAALATGLDAVTGEIVLIQDADLEYDPRDYPKLLQPILEGQADVVYGSRFQGGPQRVMFFWHRMGNLVVTTLSNMLTDLNLSDMETGYKAFRREALEGIRIRSGRFGVEPELTAKLAHRKLRFYEVPISYHGRGYEEGKKIGWRDGLAAIWHILRYNLFR